MKIRTIRTSDTEPFFQMMCRLDEETDYMIYEPGERERTSPGLDLLRGNIERAVSGGDLLLVAETDSGEIAGYIWANRGNLNRTQHMAYIVTGIRQAYRSQGIGSAFFERLMQWAGENGVRRLELSVVCGNSIAVHLYEKFGFAVEGVRRQVMKINGEYADEYYMGKILE